MSGRSYDSSQHGKAPSPFIPLTFVALGLLGLCATLLWMLAGDPSTLAVLHALAVGVFLTIALGLLYQFIPVVSLGTLRFPALAYVHAILAAAGTGCIVFGFQTASFGFVLAGGIAHGTGLALQLIVLLATVRFRLPPPAAAAAMASLAWLLGTIALGIVMAERLSHAASTSNLPYIHGLIGLAGFFGTLIVGVTLRLLRMFERVDRELFIAQSDAFVHAGVFVALFGGFAQWALPIAFAPFARSLASIARERNPAYQPETAWYTLCSTAGALVAALLFAGGRYENAIVCALWMFIGTAVVGYLQRIVPFIWWIRRARTEGARSIPTLAEMNSSPLGVAILVCWLVAGAFLLGEQTRSAALLGLVTLVGLCAQLSRPFVLKKKALVSAS